MPDLYRCPDFEAQHFLGVEEAPANTKQAIPRIYHEYFLLRPQRGVNIDDVLCEDITPFQDVVFHSVDDFDPVLRRMENLLQRSSAVNCESKEPILGSQRRKKNAFVVDVANFVGMG